MVTCKKCGSENIDNALFCKECGTPMNKFSSGKTITFKYTFRRLNVFVKIPFIIGMIVVLLFFFSVISRVYFTYKLDDINQTYTSKIEKGLDYMKTRVEDEHDHKIDTLEATPVETVYNLLVSHLGDSYYNNNDKIDTLKKYLGNKSGEYIDLVEDYTETDRMNYNIEEIIIPTSVLSFIFLLSCTFILFFRFNYRWKVFHIDEKYDYAKERVKKYIFKKNEDLEHFHIKENPKGELNLKDKEIGPRGYFHLLKDDDGNVIVIGEKYGAMNFIRSVFGKEINFIEN